MTNAVTLVELLAIIAILAAILFPVFAQAKDAAKASVCLSDVRQLGTSFNLYLANADRRYRAPWEPVGRRRENAGRTFPGRIAVSLTACREWDYGQVFSLYAL